MRNSLLIWNGILTLLVGFLLIKQLGPSKKKSTAAEKNGNNNNLPSGSFRIAYFEMDSVANKFDLVKDLRNELNSREEAINTEMAKRAKDIQNKILYYQKLAEDHKLSAEQSESANQEIRGMDEGMKNRKQELDQDYTNYMVTKQNEIKSKIEDFLKEYNRTKNYTYIVSYEQGLFYYRDSAYNITSDVVKGLNEKYRPTKK